MNATTTKAPSLKAQLAAAMELIATLQAAQVTATAQASATLVSPRAASNCLGSKAFARDILELIAVDADYRTDEEAQRNAHISDATLISRARAWAFERRSVWTQKFAVVAMSHMEYIAPVSGKWPADYVLDAGTPAEMPIAFGDKGTGRYIAIY